MEWTPRTWPTSAQELLAARASRRLGDEIGLAVRADRHRLGLSRRAYAAHRGLTRATVVRLESAADGMTLADVVAALERTAFVLCLCRRPTGDEPAPALACRPPDRTTQVASATPASVEPRSPRTRVQPRRLVPPDRYAPRLTVRRDRAC